MALSLALPIQAETESATIRSGHSGHWYDTARDGEGFALEMLENDGALLYWFTYDEQGRQRWLIASGQTEQDESGEYLDFPSLIVTRGGRFGPDFDPDDVVREEVGSATLRFSDCDSGEFAFEAFDQSMSFPVQRLAHTMGMPCESRNGVPGRETSELAGQSGSWFDLSHDGEGYSLQWIDPQRALLTWYSYDTTGEQYWMIGVGELDDQGQLLFPDLAATRGARFGAAFAPEHVERFDWGELTLALGCDEGSAQYASVLLPFGQGGLELQRLTQPRGLSCPYQRPTLTDLYEISIRLIPLATGDGQRAYGGGPLTNEGTLYGSISVRQSDGSSTRELVRITADASQWEVLPDGDLGSRKWFASSDGTRFGRHRTEHNADGAFTQTLFEVRDGNEPWVALFSITEPDSFVTAAARDFSAFVGGSGPESDLPAWRWTAENGRQPWPALPDSGQYQPVLVAVSSDQGRTVAGYQISNLPEEGRAVRYLRWAGDDTPQTLYDREGVELSTVVGCNADCSVIFGSGQYVEPWENAVHLQPWYWRGPGDSAYLGTANIDADHDERRGIHRILGISADGSLIAGRFYQSPSGSISGTRWEAMVWTQRTGPVSLGPLLDQVMVAQSFGAGAWDRDAGSVSDDGSKIFVTSGFTTGFGTILPPQRGILHLQPRSEDW